MKSTKIPDLSHLQLLIFSQQLASSGLQQYWISCVGITASERMSGLLLPRGKVEGILKVEEQLSNQPALAIINQFLINTRRSTVVESDLKDLISHILEPDRQAILPVTGASEDRFTLGKSAIFDGYKMAATIDKTENPWLTIVEE